MRVLVSAYACEPNKGSEPGVGWETVSALSEHHDVWVITRENNANSIREYVSLPTKHRVEFIYFDLPRWLRFWKKGRRGVRAYYYLWQIAIFFVARRLHREVGFDVVHHVTFAKYSAPSLLSGLPIPFIWGPVGGGERSPRRLWATCGVGGVLYECLRNAGMWLADHDPLIKFTLRRASVAVASNKDTAKRLKRLGAKNVEVISQAALNRQEREELAVEWPVPHEGVRFITVCNLRRWKGIHLALRAFAASGFQQNEMWIVGSGPADRFLKHLTQELGIQEHVTFWGQIGRQRVFDLLRQADVFVFPSMHDSAGWAAAEAMAAGLPVICLDVGGPRELINEKSGFRVLEGNPQPTVRRLADAMRRLAGSDGLRQAMRDGARERIAEIATWETKAELYSKLYREAVENARLPEPAAIL